MVCFSLTTDLEKGGVIEFKNKEGKWFGVPSGSDGKSFPALDRFSTQGLGQVASSTYAGTATGNVTVTLKNNAASVSGETWD